MGVGLDWMGPGVPVTLCAANELGGIFSQELLRNVSTFRSHCSLSLPHSPVMIVLLRQFCDHNHNNNNNIVPESSCKLSQTSQMAQHSKLKVMF
jgi:hypothetical protein